MTDSANREIIEFQEMARRFYEIIGHCITRYQSIEDHLSEIFCAAIRGNDARNTAIFNVAKGLDQKISLISAALTTRGKEVNELWNDLRVRIKAAADTRNQIAHAHPVQHGNTVIITQDGDGNFQVAEVKQDGGLRLHKRTTNKHITWTRDELRAEHAKLDDLFCNLIVLSQILKKNKVSGHLLQAWPLAQSYANKKKLVVL